MGRKKKKKQPQKTVRNVFRFFFFNMVKFVRKKVCNASLKRLFCTKFKIILYIYYYILLLYIIIYILLLYISIIIYIIIYYYIYIIIIYIYYYILFIYIYYYILFNLKDYSVQNLKYLGGSPHEVVADLLDCDMIVSSFVL